jgi:hypothetical protein
MRIAPRLKTCSGLALVIAAFAVVTSFSLIAQSGPGGGKDPDARARQRIEGSFELEEWKAGDKLLHPPQIEGRFSLHNGIVLFMTMRKDVAIPETSVGYGTYHFEPGLFTYGYSYVETVQPDAQGILSRRVSPPSTMPLKLEWKGDVLLGIGKVPTAANTPTRVSSARSVQMGTIGSGGTSASRQRITAARYTVRPRCC